MPWTPINSQSDIDELMKTFGNFHDGCIREMHMWTQQYVHDNLSMTVPFKLGASVRMLFQRQFSAPSAIELQFDQVIGIHITPHSEEYDGIIFDASVVMIDDTFIWGDGDPKDIHQSWNWIQAKSLRWRDKSRWMGNELRYGDDPASSQPL